MEEDYSLEERMTGSIEIAQVPLQQHKQMTNWRSLIARQSKYKLCYHNPALGWLGVKADTNSQTQDCKGDKELEEFNDELGCLVLVVMRLLWRLVCSLLGDGWGINLSNIVLVHHFSGTITMTHILKIIGCILPWKSYMRVPSNF